MLSSEAILRRKKRTGAQDGTIDEKPRPGRLSSARKEDLHAQLSARGEREGILDAEGSSSNFHNTL